MNTLLLDENTSPSLRQALGACLARATRADLAIARIRLAVVDLTAEELARVRKMRVLVGRLDVESLAAGAPPLGRGRDGGAATAGPDGGPVTTGPGSDPDTGAPVTAGPPDGGPGGGRTASGGPVGGAPGGATAQTPLAPAASVLLPLFDNGRLEVRAAGLQGWYPDFSVLRGLAGGGATTFLGAHYFARPYPSDGPALTCILTDPAHAAAAAARFEQLWRLGYDVSHVVRAALERVL